MKGLKYLILITHREYTEKYLEFFRNHNLPRVNYKLCYGTASEKMLSYLGIDNNDKVMFETMVTTPEIKQLEKDLYLEMDIGAAGNGLAVFIPIDGVGGQSSLRYFVGDRTFDKEKEEMTQESKNVLIMTIVDKGNTDLVMNSARDAGASGGTVVRAKGTGAEIAKFFGVSITEEKEMVYIVSSRESRDAIMQAIMDKAGAKTQAHGIVFSLPVDKVVGIKHFEDI